MEANPPADPLTVHWTCQLCGHRQLQQFTECPNCCTNQSPLKNVAEIRGDVSGDFVFDRVEWFDGVMAGNLVVNGDLVIRVPEGRMAGHTGTLTFAGSIDQTAITDEREIVRHLTTQEITLNA